MPDPLDTFRQEFYDALKEIYERLKAHEEEVNARIVEYRKTVNTAITLLSKELFDFQETDRRERVERQKRQDIKDAAIGCLLLAFLLTSCAILTLGAYLLAIGRL